MTATELPDRIRRIRMALDLERVQLADLLDMSYGTYSEREKGIRPFKVEHLEKLAAFFKITFGELTDTPTDELIILVLTRARGGAKS